MSLYQNAKNRLKAAGIESPDLEARLILKHALNVTDADIITGAVPADSAAVEAILCRRLAGEPLSRIFGEREFYGLTFRVTPDVLDPRPDTETIINAVRERGLSPRRILDLGTGSGCLLVTLLHLFPEAEGVGVDMSPAALAIAAENAGRNGVAARARFLRGSWFEPLADESFDLIVTNPPYIPSRDIPNLDKAVRDFDPIQALDGGADGFDAYKIIVREIERHLFPGGRAFIEAGISQADEIARLAEEARVAVVRQWPDLAGIPRVVEISSGEK